MLNEHCEFFHMASLTTTARPPHRGAGSIAVTAVAPVQFAYRDKRLGDTETVMVETYPDVFYPTSTTVRSEEHTSELQSRLHLVCRLLLEKKKKRRFRALTSQRPSNGKTH